MNKNNILTNKKVLVVDDDVHNLFALTTGFERYSIQTITAEKPLKIDQLLSLIESMVI